MDKGFVVNPPKHVDFQALDKVGTHERTEDTTKCCHHQPKATKLARSVEPWPTRGATPTPLPQDFGGQANLALITYAYEYAHEA